MATVTVKLTVHMENMFTNQQVFDTVYAELSGTVLDDYTINDIAVEEGEFRNDAPVLAEWAAGREDESLQFGDDSPPGYEDPRELDPDYSPGEPDDRVSYYLGDRADLEAAEAAADITGGKASLNRAQIGTVYIDDDYECEPVFAQIDGVDADEAPVVYFDVPLAILGEVVRHTVCVWFNPEDLKHLEDLIAKTRERVEHLVEESHS